MATEKLLNALATLFAKTDAVSSEDVRQRIGITRQVTWQQLSRLVDEGALVKTGRGVATRYRLPPRPPDGLLRLAFPLSGLRTQDVWAAIGRTVPTLAALPPAPRELARYCVEQLVDNAIEHSGGRQLTVRIGTGNPLTFEIGDDGVGLFERLRAGLQLTSPEEAAQELGKPNRGTPSASHAGEGLFFVGKAAFLTLESAGLRWQSDPARNDTALARVAASPGTRATIRIATDARTTLADVFAAWTSGFRISRTQVCVRLFEFGVPFVSRAEARRLLTGLDSLRELVLDFRGIEGIGEAFAGEIFGLWAGEHPNVHV